jgi:hypothetical protein
LENTPCGGEREQERECAFFFLKGRESV